MESLILWHIDGMILKQKLYTLAYVAAAFCVGLMQQSSSKLTYILLFLIVVFALIAFLADCSRQQKYLIIKQAINTNPIAYDKAFIKLRLENNEN